jgi:VIT1/CCC1 family predicted Fe2+/Mn2+ transporter
MDLVIVLVPILLVSIPNAFRFLMGKFELLEFMLDLHIAGIAMMMPLPFLKPSMAGILTYVTVLSTMALLLTAACYMNEQLNPRKAIFREIGFGVGASVFTLGIGLVLFI